MPAHRSFRLVRLALVAVLAACGGSEGGSTTGPGGSTPTGTLSVAISGLPGGASASVSVSGPGGFARTLTASTTLTDLAAGAYIVAAAEATHGEDRYAAAPGTQSVTVSASQTATASVGYAIASGSLRVIVGGLPDGTDAQLVVSGPSGFSRTVGGTRTIGGLAPGTYTLTASVVAAQGHSWTPAATATTVTVSAGTTPATATVTWALATGAITTSISGLPTGAAGSATITGPAGYSRTVLSGETVTNLAPGSYTVTGAAVTVGDDQYRPPQALALTVLASPTPQAASLTYALASGKLAVSVTGLPSGATPSVSVTGPGGYARTLTGSETITGLTPGSYTLTANDVTASGVTYGVASPVQVTVAASTQASAASVTYGVTKGSLTIVVNGLPQSIPAAISVSGPDNYSTTVATTTTLQALKPGTYTVSAALVTAGLHKYAATPASQQVTVGAVAAPSQASVGYALSSGLLNLTVNGLPLNVPGNITITGPGGYSRAVTGSTLITGLTPGTYTIAAALTQSGGSSWAGNPASQNVSVPASTSATQATVTYQSASGGLNVTIAGLPGGVNAAVTITGPGNFSQVLTATTALTGLLQGTYTLTAAAVVSGGSTYSVTPATQLASVGGGVTSSITITYVASGGPPPPPPTLNLTIDGMHVQQVVQTYAGAVPLVANKDGLLRVFVKASMSNAATAAVRVRFYNGATLQSTVTIAAPSSSVPTTVSQTPLTSSWNTTIPAALMQPGLRILADVDPTNTVTESSDSDNTFPTNGTAQSMDVRALPSLDVRFVPVTQSANGTTGDVNVGNASQYLADALAVFPVGAYNIDVRAPYTTNAPVLQADDNNGAWGQVLSEISALRSAEGSSRYYAGIAKVTYGSGIAGLGYVPGRATLSWDDLPSASEVVAHELGHNFGRFHAPCGGAGNPDPSYPYGGGVIGQYGYSLGTSSLKAPTLTDLMGYCSNNWISDYTYTAVLNHRIANPLVATTSSLARNMTPRPGLLVWGRIHRGQVILEPAYEVVAAPSLPTRGGNMRLRAFGPIGQSLIDLSFDGDIPGDSPDASARHFSFVIPLDLLGGLPPERIRLEAGGRAAERRGGAPGAMRTAATPTATREGTRGVRVRWTDPGIAGVLVRDARTGEILSFGRSGDVTVASPASDVELTWSDGVRSTTQRVRVAPPRL